MGTVYWEAVYCAVPSNAFNLHNTIFLQIRFPSSFLPLFGSAMPTPTSGQHVELACHLCLVS